jgi:hypothetical protein
MYFANPVAGLRNMRKALRPGGRIVNIVWRRRADKPRLSMAKDVVLRFLPEPGAYSRLFTAFLIERRNTGSIRCVCSDPYSVCAMCAPNCRE